MKQLLSNVETYYMTPELQVTNTLKKLGPYIVPLEVSGCPGRVYCFLFL